MQEHQKANRQVFWIAFTTGLGLMGALDAIGFHHLLQWHNFYVHGGDFWRSFSDGLLHVLTTGLLFAGVILLWRHRHLISRGRASGLALAAGLWLGMGVFQLIDGTLFHLVLRLHPVREGASNLLPYDAAWIGSALLLILIGWLLLQRLKRQAR